MSELPDDAGGTATDPYEHIDVSLMRYALDVERDLPYAAPEVQLVEFRRRLSLGERDG